MDRNLSITAERRREKSDDSRTREKKKKKKKKKKNERKNKLTKSEGREYGAATLVVYHTKKTSML
jgi:hypothetical protein